MKKCTKCGEEKDIAEFNKDKGTKDGLTYQCKFCIRKTAQAWKDKNRERVRELDRKWRLNHPKYGYEQKKGYRKTHELELKNANLLYYFGISLDDFNKLLEKQNNACAICETNYKEFKIALAVDHDHNCCPQKKHACNKCIRGLLCSTCNNLLGRAKDNVVILLNAIKYLEKYKHG